MFCPTEGSVLWGPCSHATQSLGIILESVAYPPMRLMNSLAGMGGGADPGTRLDSRPASLGRPCRPINQYGPGWPEWRFRAIATCGPIGGACGWARAPVLVHYVCAGVSHVSAAVRVPLSALSLCWDTIIIHMCE